MATTRKSDHPQRKPMSENWISARGTSPSFPGLCFERVGNPQLNVFRVKLPTNLMEGLTAIIDDAEKYALQLQSGWKTDLYSLTKCDMACKDIPGMSELVKPVFDYICHSIQILYSSSSCQQQQQQKVVVDKNQPHILKYSADTGHTGVELHHDRCDVTANLALSHRSDYVGGGTFIVDVGRVIEVDRGEFLLHPGSLVHGGMDITEGTRYLLVTFAHLRVIEEVDNYLDDYTVHSKEIIRTIRSSREIQITQSILLLYKYSSIIIIYKIIQIREVLC